MSNIIQNTQEWSEAKKSKIGGSEIYALAYYYCKNELKAIGVDLEKEQPFRTALEIYLKVAFGLEEDSISDVNARFGLGMEVAIFNKLNFLNSNAEYKQSKEFFINEDVHELAACSPDGFILPYKNFEMQDFDKKGIITKLDGEGMVEIKTTNFDFNYQSEFGASFQYIFQLMYNMMICNNKWGLLALLTPKERAIDNDFDKGVILGRQQMMDELRHKIPDLLIDEELDKYSLFLYYYKPIKSIQDICLLALKRFQSALKSNILPNISKDNQEKLLREKKLLAQIYPERFGTLEANQEIDCLLNERQVVSKEIKKIETEKEFLNCEIIKAMKDHIAVKGENYQAIFDKRGSLRFSEVRATKN